MPVKSRHGRFKSIEGAYAGLVGMFLALSLLKWGNPVIMDGQVGWPGSLAEWRVASWPISIGYFGFGLVLFASIAFARRDVGVPLWVQSLPAAWLCWQAIAAVFSIQPALSWMVIPHFGVCVGLFFIGLHCFSNIERPLPFWIALVGGFAVVLAVGWHQHFVGLENMRRFLYSLPNWRELPPEFLNKVASERIYSTLVYPNTLASVIILLTPPSLGLLGQLSRFPGMKRIGIGVLLTLSVGSLVWSGSKAGWLIALVQAIVFLLLGNFPRWLKISFAFSLLVLGLIGFAVKYQDYFQRGATSIGARFDYWNAAWITITRAPFLGSGPGTFAIYYRELKQPAAEMTRLAHNDYLQQASDSGLVGATVFVGFWAVGLVSLYRNRSHSALINGAFIGIFGVALQSFIEFGLYIPGVAWVTWFLFGWALSSRNAVDKSPRRS